MIPLTSNAGKSILQDVRAWFIGLICSAIITAVGAQYKSVLADEQHQHLHLDALQIAIASTPVPVALLALGVIFIITFALAYSITHWAFRKRATPVIESERKLIDLWMREKSGRIRDAREREDTESSKPDFRVVIENLTVDRTTGNPVVAAAISVTNYGDRYSIDRWQMLYWCNGIKKEAGKQDLQHPGWCLVDSRTFARYVMTWGYDDFIERITKQPFASGEKREGVFWAVLTDSAAIEESDIRTVYLQYQAAGHTFESPSVGANLAVGTVTPTK